MKETRFAMIALLAISVVMLISAGNSGVAYAQSAQPCTATLSQPVIPSQYGNSNVPFVVPISASCTTYYGQLYANANAYDATTNTALGTATTVMSSVNGGTQFTGQLSFSLLPQSPTDSVQISVSVYDNQGGNLLTQTSATIQVGTGPYPSTYPPLQQVTTTTVTVGQYPLVSATPPFSNYQPNQFQNYQQQPAYHQQNQHLQSQGQYFPQGFRYRSNNTTLLDWVVIIAIIAAVIIATAGIVIIARKQQRPQPVWYPLPPPPPTR
jgi:hypothetical protein